MTAGRLIAIGDIHGCSLALQTLLDSIQLRPSDTIVALGDVVDRGRDSKGVVEQLLDLRQRCAFIGILGNHEEMLLAAGSSTVEMRGWIRSGGARTLDSYGFGGGVEMIPREHTDFLREFRDYYEADSHIFLHANYVPHLPLDQQPPMTLRWAPLRYRLPGPHCSGKTVVVGHTPQECGEILDLGYLKCIETDVIGGGWLTALDVISGQVWQANKEGRRRGGE